ncbi:16814_t:CDS:1, partial [Gigaspora rosea]
MQQQSQPVVKPPQDLSVNNPAILPSIRNKDITQNLLKPMKRTRDPPRQRGR